MNRRYRKTIIAGNWKMNKTLSEAKVLLEQVKQKCAKAKWCEVVCCVPYIDIPLAVRLMKDCRISIAAQNVHHEVSGAFTGEVSAPMLKEAGVKYVIVGHSERRAYFGETDEIVAKKITASLEAGLRPIVCVGESLQQREMGIMFEIIGMQVKAALSVVTADKLRNIVFAYEPIWAIGTGKTATSEQAAEVCSFIRAVVRRIYGARSARSLTIQYGGSMNASNAFELLSQLDIDGGLIGGASLNADSFNSIVQAANQP